MINVVNDNNHSQSHPTWRRERPIKTLEKRGKSHVEQVWGKGTLIASTLDWLLVKTCYAGCQAMICRTLYSGQKTKKRKTQTFLSKLCKFSGRNSELMWFSVVFVLLSGCYVQEISSIRSWLSVTSIRAPVCLESALHMQWNCLK